MSGFLRRWADRKAGLAEPNVAPPAAADAPEDAEAPLAPPVAALPPEDAEAAEDIAAKLAALPPLEEIGAQADIRPFLQAFVPAALRNAAMRRAWAADPIISTHLDVARDYAWEFNVGELPVGFSRTLGADAVQRSLDALGEIGAEPLQREAESAQIPDGQAEALEPEASDATESLAEVEAPELAPQEAVREAPDSPVSSLLLRPRHGSALPS